MATAHIIQVPVETLEIIELPGMKTLKKYEYKTTPYELLHATMTLKSGASSKTFKRKVVFSGIRVIADITESFEAFLTDHPVANHIVLFRCTVSGQEFTGSYDYATHKGQLEAYMYDESEESYEPETTWNL